VPFFSHLFSHTSFSPEHQVATSLYESDALTLMLLGFEPGQCIPEHAGPVGAFYVVEGQGWISIDGERQEVGPGTVAVAPENARRGIEAKTRLALLVSRGKHNAS